jgi:hypothetical protein
VCIVTGAIQPPQFSLSVIGRMHQDQQSAWHIGYFQMIAEFVAVPHSYPVPSFGYTGYARFVLKPGQFSRAAKWMLPRIYTKQAVGGGLIIGCYNEDLHCCCFLVCQFNNKNAPNIFFVVGFVRFCRNCRICRKMAGLLRGGQITWKEMKAKKNAASTVTIFFVGYKCDKFVTIIFSEYKCDKFVTIIFAEYKCDKFVTIIFVEYKCDKLVTIIFVEYKCDKFVPNVSVKNKWDSLNSLE